MQYIKSPISQLLKERSSIGTQKVRHPFIGEITTSADQQLEPDSTNDGNEVHKSHAEMNFTY